MKKPSSVLLLFHICAESSSFNKIISAGDISCRVAELEVSTLQIQKCANCQRKTQNNGLWGLRYQLDND